MTVNKTIICLVIFHLLKCISAPALAVAPLADAVEKKDLAAVRSLLKKQVDINAAQVDGMTALHWAAHQDDYKTAELLVDAGADVKAANRYGITPLSSACINGNSTMVKLFLQFGADPNTTLHGGETALMSAARTGKLDAVQALLDHGADVNRKERKGQTAVMWASAEGHAKVVEMLIEAGADFRRPLNSGFTPLFFAAREGRSEVVQVLLKAGADADEKMNTKRSRGRSPSRGTSPLILAVENGHFDLAMQLIKAGSDPNDQQSGFTPLHIITWVRKPNRGDGIDGDPAPRGSGKTTSLQFVRKLVAAGADVNRRLKRGSAGRGRLNKTGATPFLLAAKTADVPLMRLLLELGADPFIPNVDNATPLMAAAGIGSIAPGEEAGTEPEALEAVKLLLKLGADVNTVDNNGETAMHGAAYKSLPKVVQFLANQGADIKIWNRKNKYGWTPLLIAEGHRPGNFKPSATTIAAIHRVMRDAGVTPPSKPTPRKRIKGYEETDASN